MPGNFDADDSFDGRLSVGVELLLLLIALDAVSLELFEYIIKCAVNK